MARLLGQAAITLLVLPKIRSSTPILIIFSVTITTIATCVLVDFHAWPSDYGHLVTDSLCDETTNHLIAHSLSSSFDSSTPLAL